MIASFQSIADVDIGAVVDVEIDLAQFDLSVGNDGDSAARLD